MNRKLSGFTLVEVMASVTILVTAMALAMTGYIYLTKNARQNDVQSELNNDAKKAIERLKKDMRLSSMTEMFYSPEGQPPYDAVSFPVAYDTDGDGIIERDSDGAIIWDETIIYHIRQGTPDELVRTVIHSRNNDISDAQRQSQLNKIVASGEGSSATAVGETASSQVIFRNLLNWSLHPTVGRFDCYAPSPERETINLGFALLDSGTHEFKFTTEKRSTASTGDFIGIDTLTVSPSYLPREAEEALPATQSSGATPLEMYNPTYSGKSFLAFQGVEGNSFTLTMDNDRWEDTNFGGRYSAKSNTVITTYYDSETEPISADNVVTLDGNRDTWIAEEQCADYNAPSGQTLAADSVVRVLVKGSSLGKYISCTGAKTRFTFAAAPPTENPNPLIIDHAYFGESLYTDNEYMAYNPASPIYPILFINTTYPETRTSFAAGGTKTSDWVATSIDPDKNYIISYVVVSGAPRIWTDYHSLIPSAQIATSHPLISADTMAMLPDNWLYYPSFPAMPTVTPANQIVGLESIFVSYAARGTYTSDIIDTTIDSPTYGSFAWNSDIPYRTRMAFKIRSGNNPALLDAPSFDSLVAKGATSQSSSLTPEAGSGRYVQYQAVLDSSDAGGRWAPMLRDIAITWTGERRLMQLSGIFSKGPDHGSFSLSVDGKELQSALTVEMEIYRDVIGIKDQVQRISAEVEVALTPRNSGL